MLWRVVHDTLKWLWPAAFGGLVAFSGVAIAASQVWPEAKTWTANAFTAAVSVLNEPMFWAAAAIVFIAWLAAFVWSGHKVTAEIAPGTPPAVQPRRQAVSPRSGLVASPRAQTGLDALVDDAADWDRQGDIQMARLLGKMDAMTLSPAPKRDTAVTETLGYAALGRWGAQLSDAIMHHGDFAAVGPPLNRFREAAGDGDLTVWGKRERHALYERIEPSFWVDHGLDLQSILLGESRTEPKTNAATAERFYDIMVNRSEVERCWPHDG
jgi:hypothetical protein